MIAELVRVGIVTSTYPDKGTVRVQLVDVDDSVSYELPVVYRKTLKDKDYWMPDLGEHVVCLFLGQGLEQGFVLGAIYSDADAVPVNSQDKWHKVFEDGTIIEYDRAEHKLTGDIKGDIDVTATGRCDLDCTGEIYAKSAADVKVEAPTVTIKGAANITLEAPTVNVIGDLAVDGEITSTGEIIADGNVKTKMAFIQI